jgi:hypothetical protein
VNWLEAWIQAATACAFAVLPPVDHTNTVWAEASAAQSASAAAPNPPKS